MELKESAYWQYLNKHIKEELEKYGYSNFKRTIVFSYFTWLVPYNNCQIRFLKKNISLLIWLKCIFLSLVPKRYEPLTHGRSLACRFLTYLIWHYAESVCGKIEFEEPLEGNPMDIKLRGKIISQDLANSMLEVQSIIDVYKNPKTIIEIGGGYGRTSYVILKKYPKCKYIIVDLPESLSIAEKYLKNQLPNADIIFLTPLQIENIKTKSVDLFINISSFHEMTVDQINYYFDQADRIIDGYFYCKQWIETKIPYSNLILKEENYPFKNKWEKIYKRVCAVQTDFFEALYKI